MSIIKVEIIDRDKENREFIEKTIFFFKYFFLPILTFIVIAIFLENLFIALISPLLVLGIIIFRKKIFNKHTGKPYWIGIGIIILILIILNYLPNISAELNKINIKTKQGNSGEKGQYDVNMIDFDNPEGNGDNSGYLFCLNVCGGGNPTYSKNIYGKYIRCYCENKTQYSMIDGNKVYHSISIHIDNSGKIITQEEAHNRYCIYKKEHDIPDIDC